MAFTTVTAPLYFKPLRQMSSLIPPASMRWGWGGSGSTQKVLFLIGSKVFSELPVNLTSQDCGSVYRQPRKVVVGRHTSESWCPGQQASMLRHVPAWSGVHRAGRYAREVKRPQRAFPAPGEHCRCVRCTRPRSAVCQI